MFEKSKTPADSLRELLKDLSETEAEIRRLQELEPVAKSEREGLIQSGKFEDSATTNAIAALDLKIRMLPHKLRQLSEFRTKLDGDLKSAATLIAHKLRDNFTSLSACVCAEVSDKVERIGIECAENLNPSGAQSLKDIAIDALIRGTPAFQLAKQRESSLAGFSHEQSGASCAQIVLQALAEIESMNSHGSKKLASWKPAKAA